MSDDYAYTFVFTETRTKQTTQKVFVVDSEESAWLLAVTYRAHSMSPHYDTIQLVGYESVSAELQASLKAARVIST